MARSTPCPCQVKKTTLHLRGTGLFCTRVQREFLNGKSVVISEEMPYDTNLLSHQFPQVESCIDSIQSVHNLYNGYCVQTPAIF